MTPHHSLSLGGKGVKQKKNSNSFNTSFDNVNHIEVVVCKNVASTSSLSNDATDNGNKKDLSSIVANIRDMQRQLLEGKRVLVGHDELPIKKVYGQVMDPFPSLADTFGIPKSSTNVSTDGTSDTLNGTGPCSYAKRLNGEPSKKVANFRTLIAPTENGADVAVSLTSKWFVDTNLLKYDVCNILMWVKFHDVPIVAFTKDGLSAIATELGTPLTLDSYTSVMCTESWGRSGYARAMLELRADAELKDSLVVAVPKIEGSGGIQIGSKSQLVYKLKKTGMTPKKTKVMNATNDASFLTTMNYFEALSNMVHVDEERVLPAVASKKVNEVVFEEDSETEVEEVHNETVNFMASKIFKVNEGFTCGIGVGNSSLYEQ
ncbi:constans-like protein [Tanacetum coccineum]